MLIEKKDNEEMQFPKIISTDLPHGPVLLGPAVGGQDQKYHTLNRVNSWNYCVREGLKIIGGPKKPIAWWGVLNQMVRLSEMCYARHRVNTILHYFVRADTPDITRESTRELKYWMTRKLVLMKAVAPLFHSGRGDAPDAS